jgi:molybdopterin-binding protein
LESPITINAVITKESVKEMALKPGDTVEAIIKSTEIIVGKD